MFVCDYEEIIIGEVSNFNEKQIINKLEEKTIVNLKNKHKFLLKISCIKCY